jgi:SPP1 family predicted phage head-tail adaptor
MDAGGRNQRITIQKLHDQADDYGDTKELYTDVATLWAKKIEKSGREQLQSEQVSSEHTFVFEIRYYSGLTTKHRVLWRDLVLDIVDIANPDMRRRLQHLTCVEHG